MSRLDKNRMREEAARWVARMDRGYWSSVQELELEQWLDTDPRRKGALLQAQAAWLALDDVQGLSQEASLIRPKRPKLMAGGLLALAASFAGLAFHLNAGVDYRTEVGEIRRVPLADGSTAAINTASAIEVDIGTKLRRVELEKGEAWFQVEKDARRPFLVEAGRVRVQAVGTAFSVRRRNDGADILVTDGVVLAWADGAAGHQVRIVAGDQAFVADNAAIRTIPAAGGSIERALAWRSGKIELVAEPLAEAVAEFNRYNDRKILLRDASIAAEQIDGIFNTDDPEGFAVAVHHLLQVPVDMSDPRQIDMGSSANNVSGE